VAFQTEKVKLICYCAQRIANSQYSHPVKSDWCRIVLILFHCSDILTHLFYIKRVYFILYLIFVGIDQWTYIHVASAVMSTSSCNSASVLWSDQVWLEYTQVSYTGPWLLHSCSYDYKGQSSQWLDKCFHEAVIKATVVPSMVATITLTQKVALQKRLHKNVNFYVFMDSGQLIVQCL